MHNKWKYNNSKTSLSYHLNMSHSAVLQAAKAEGITQRICNVVTTDMLPINVVDGQGVREVIKYIEPGYNIPDRTT